MLLIVHTFIALTQLQVAVAPGAGQTGLVQRQGQPSRPVVVVLVERFADSTARAVVVRQPNRQNGEFILLRESTGGAADLLAAIALLQRSRALDGDAYRYQLQMTLGMSAAVRQAPGEAALIMSRALERARAPPLRDIPGVGRGRAIVLAIDRFRHGEP